MTLDSTWPPRFLELLPLLSFGPSFQKSHVQSNNLLLQISVWLKHKPVNSSLTGLWAPLFLSHTMPKSVRSIILFFKKQDLHCSPKVSLPTRWLFQGDTLSVGEFLWTAWNALYKDSAYSATAWVFWMELMGQSAWGDWPTNTEWNLDCQWGNIFVGCRHHALVFHAEFWSLFEFITLAVSIFAPSAMEHQYRSFALSRNEEKPVSYRCSTAGTTSETIPNRIEYYIDIDVPEGSRDPSCQTKPLRRVFRSSSNQLFLLLPFFSFLFFLFRSSLPV